MKLYSDISKALGMGGIAVSVGINALSQPPGANYCDVYLLDQNDYLPFENKEDGKWKIFTEGTRENLKQGIVKIKECCRNGKYFLGFKNPDSGYGLNILIEVVAIVEKTTYEKIKIKRPVSIRIKQVPITNN